MKRADLWEAWGREWRAALALGLTPESIDAYAPNEEILRRGKELRKQVIEARESWKSAERLDVAGFARLAGIKKDHAAGILTGRFPMTEQILEGIEAVRPGCLVRVNTEDQVLEIREETGNDK